jgi:hypothetical protein
MLSHLLIDALVNVNRTDRPRNPNASVSDAARAATEWIGAGLEHREKALCELLGLADALPPQPKSGPPLAKKVVAVHQALDEAHIPHAFGGALAVAYYGEPRATGDIDVNVFVPVDDWKAIRVVLAPLEIATDISENDLRRLSEAQLDWGSTPVHLFFSSDPLHQRMSQKTRSAPFNGSVIPLISPEHLLVRKAILNRPKDWHDIEQVLVASSPLNLEEIREWLQQLVKEDDRRIAKLDEIRTALKLAW